MGMLGNKIYIKKLTKNERYGSSMTILQTVQILSHTCVLVLYDISQSPLVDDVLTYATQKLRA